MMLIIRRVLCFNFCSVIIEREDNQPWSKFDIPKYAKKIFLILMGKFLLACCPFAI